MFGYATFRANVADNIMLSYPPKEAPAEIGRFAVILLVCFSYPLLSHPGRMSLVRSPAIMLNPSIEIERVYRMDDACACLFLL